MSILPGKHLYEFSYKSLINALLETNKKGVFSPTNKKLNDAFRASCSSVLDACRLTDKLCQNLKMGLLPGAFWLLSCSAFGATVHAAVHDASSLY